jgi:hypothetical protein
MGVQMGLSTATEAAKSLGITRAYYYVLEDRILRATLSAATPKKRGPRREEADPKEAAMETRLKYLEREKEILELKVKHLESLQREMVTRGVGVLREKKRPARAASRRSRKAVHGEVSRAGAEGSRRAEVPGRAGAGPLPGDGPRPGEPVALAGEGGCGGHGGNEAGPPPF